MNPRNTKTKIERPVVIAVEGMDEFSTLINLVEYYNLGQEIQFFVYRSVGGSLKNCLAALKKAPGFENVKALGAIGDCETGRAKEHSSFVDAFHKIGYDASGSEWSKSGDISCAFLLLPPDKDEGCLEDVFIDSLRDKQRVECGDQLLKCVERNDLLPTKAISEKANQWRTKALARSVLVTHNDPGIQIGASFKTELWDQHSESFEIIAAFLERATEIGCSE